VSRAEEPGYRMSDLEARTNEQNRKRSSSASAAFGGFWDDDNEGKANGEALPIGDMLHFAPMTERAGALPSVAMCGRPLGCKRKMRILTGRSIAIMCPALSTRQHVRWPMCGRPGKVKGETAKLVTVRKRSCVRPRCAVT